MKTETVTSSAPQSGGSPTPTDGPKRLYRSRDNRVIKGVAGGVGEHLGIDPVLVRLAFLFTFALGGVGFFLYVLAVVLLPKRPKNLVAPRTPTTSGFEALQNRSLGVWIVLGIGASIVVDRLNLNIIGDRLWPLLLIGGGLVVLMRRRDANALRENDAVGSRSTSARATTSPSSAMPPRSATSSTLIGDAPTRRDLHAEALAELHDPVVDEVERVVAELRSERLGTNTMTLDADPVRAPRPRRRSSRVRRLVTAFLILIVFLTTVTAFLGLRILTRGAGQRNVVVPVGETKFSQTFGAGDLSLDLRALNAGATGKVSLDFGHLLITLPNGPDRPQVEISARSRIVIAETGVGQSTEVFFGDRTRTIAGCGRNATSARSTPVETVKLDISMLAGNVDLVPGGPCPSPTASFTRPALSLPNLLSTATNSLR